MIRICLCMACAIAGANAASAQDSSASASAIHSLYGTTQYGGQYNDRYGVVFKVDQTGKFTLLHKFTGQPDGEQPFGRLAADSSGNLYGTTIYGGAFGGYG